MLPLAPSVRYQITPTKSGNTAEAERAQARGSPQPAGREERRDLTLSTYMVQPRLACNNIL